MNTAVSDHFNKDDYINKSEAQQVRGQDKRTIVLIKISHIT